MKTLHKHRAFTRLRALVADHRTEWGAVELEALSSHDPPLLVLTTCVGLLMDMVDDRLDELQEGVA